MEKTSRIYVAGHKGMVGGALVRALHKNGYTNIILKEKHELNLLDQKSVFSFFEEEAPDYVFLAAAKVGGILGNRDHPADFIYENMVIQTNIIHAAHIHSTKKLLFLGSSCIYPKYAPQPMGEEVLLTGELEPTNEYYAIAKIAGLKLCEAYRKQYGKNFISVMPTNLYGQGDNYHPHNSHVLPALIRRFHEAKEHNTPSVIIWGTGSPRREFLHVDDLALACLHLMDHYDEIGHVNIGTGEDISIKELVRLIQETVGYTGDVVYDTSKPDGTPRKLLDVSKIKKLGWQHTLPLNEGIKLTYQSFLEEIRNGTLRS